jgi:negative regulator of flagellin synthesis FlgM
VQISSAADFVAQAQQLPDVRADRVASIRAAIADGSYETADKLDAALSAMLDEIA